jgi:gluconolactonase
LLDAFSQLVGGLDHPEGVAWDPRGFIVAGGEAGQIYRIELDGGWAEVTSTGGFIYGVTPSGSGDVFACDFGRTQVARVSPTGDVTPWTMGTPNRPLRVPNFAAFDDRGTLFVTDSGQWGADDGAVFAVAPDGGTDVWTESVAAFPNGCCISADGMELIVVESRERRIVGVPIDDRGRAGPPREIARLIGSQPDGIALAEDGTMLVGCFRPDRIWVVTPDGDVSVLADDPDGVVLNQPANLAFVGPALDRIVVSSLGGWNVMTADVGLRGLPLRYPHLV